MTNTKQIITVTHGIQEYNGHATYNSKPKPIEEIMDEEADTHDNHEAESGKDKQTIKRETGATKWCLKSILILISLSGCYDFNRVTNNMKDSVVKDLLSYIFRLSLLLVVILAMGKCVYAFFYLDASQVIINGLHVSWVCLCMCNFLVHFKCTSTRVGNQEDAFKKFDEILQEFNQQGIDWPMLKVKRHVNIWSVIGCLIAIVNVLGIALQCAVRDQSRAFYTMPFPPNALSLSLFFVAELVATLMWIFPWIYSISMCNMVRQAFNSFNDYLKREFCGNACSIPKDIHRMRVLHLKLCDIVSALDADMGWYFASSCVFNLGLLCITLYKTVKTLDIDGYSMFLYVFWLSSALVILGLLTTFAALVNDRAHALLNTLYYIDMKDVGIDQVTQLNLFLSKLTGTQVGFTTCGLLTITKEFILTAETIDVVGVIEPPFLMKNGDFYEGLVPDILDRITSSLNINYTLTNMSRYGALNDKGDWTGMMDKLVKKDADVAAILTATYTRSKFVDFSYPVMSVGPVIVLKRPPKERFRITENLDSLFQPFDFTVWLMTILAFFVTGTVLYMISHFNPYEWRRMSKDREATLREAESFTCANSFWFALSALCFQGFVRAPRSVGGRLVVTAWWIFVLLFLFSYLACLTNYLRVGPKPLEAEGYSKIRGFGDLAKTDDIKVLVVPYGATENYFKTAVLETEKRIYKKIVDTRKVLSIDGRDDGIEKIKESAFSDIVMILESSSARHITQQPPCDLYMVSDSLISAQQSFAFPAGSKYTGLFNAELLKMREAGELRNLEHKWFPAQCENSVVDIDASGTYEFSRFYKLDLGAFSGAVLILGIGLILGGLAAVIECCIYKWAETVNYYLIHD